MCGRRLVLPDDSSFAALKPTFGHSLLIMVHISCGTLREAWREVRVIRAFVYKTETTCRYKKKVTNLTQ